MRLNAQSIAEITFREGDSRSTHFAKLEFLRRAMIEGTLFGTRTLNFSITDGLPLADPAEPLVRLRVPDNWAIEAITADAGDAATGTVALRFKKDGVDNGEIEFTGTVGTPTPVDPYPAESLFELYPPLVADPTLDDVSISIRLLVG